MYGPEDREAEEIIQYIKNLKKGFDKDEFNLRIENLAHFVDSQGLGSDNFHKLFKIWLSLSIRKCLAKSVTATNLRKNQSFL